MIEDKVLKEQDVLELLGISRETLDNLRREKGFPFVRVTNKARVYLDDDILQWLKQHKPNKSE